MLKTYSKCQTFYLFGYNKNEMLIPPYKKPA